MFLFVVAVVLLNLLIAQYSKTCDDELENARVSLTLERALILTRQNASLWIKLIVSMYIPTSALFENQL